jgi:hypothetical protein
MNKHTTLICEIAARIPVIMSCPFYLSLLDPDQYQ